MKKKIYFFLLWGTIVSLSFQILTQESSLVLGARTVVNDTNKDQPAGQAIAEISGVCGQDYRLVSPYQATKWNISIEIVSEMENQPVHIWIIEVIGEYPYNYEEQVKDPNTPYARGIGKAKLIATLDPSKKYEAWIRDAYAKLFTGTIEENWESEKVVIDNVFVSNNRCDVGSIQTVGFHAKMCQWKVDSYKETNVSYMVLYINETKYLTNETGWVSFDVTYNTLGKRIWNVTRVSYPNYLVNITLPSIIWDRVRISIKSEKERVNVGSKTPINWVGTYESDGSPFLGIIIFNDTFVKEKVGKYSYKVTQIFDPEYNLSAFKANEVSVIFDRVNITLEIVDNRIDVGSNATIFWIGFYEYDGKPFTGFITLNDTTIKNRIGKYYCTVQKISDLNYGLSDFTSNSIYCIWDQVNVTIYTEDNRIEVGKKANITHQAVYGYNRESLSGSVFLNDTVLSQDYVGKRGYKVSRIRDEKYGLTKFTTNEVTIIWDKLDITLVTFDMSFPGSIKVTVKPKYQYDSSPVENATVKINGLVARKIENGIYEAILPSWMPYLNVNVKIEKVGFKSITKESIVYSLGNILLEASMIILVLIVGLGLYAKKLKGKMG